MSEIEGFAGRIFSLRKSANKSQEEIGAVLGLTKSGVSSFEKGKSIPSPENLVKLARLFKVSVDYLLTGQNWIKRDQDSENTETPNNNSVSSATGSEGISALEVEVFSARFVKDSYSTSQEGTQGSRHHPTKLSTESKELSDISDTTEAVDAQGQLGEHSTHMQIMVREEHNGEEIIRWANANELLSILNRQ